MSASVASPPAEPLACPSSADARIVGRDILCFSHDWAGDPLSKTHLMRCLARNNRVLWVNSIGYRTPGVNRADLGRAWKKLVAARQPLREVEPNIFVLNPLAIPVYGLGMVRKVNQWWLRMQVRRAMRQLGFSRPQNWVFNPAAAIIAGKLGEERVIYHCGDEYSAFSGVAAGAIQQLETQLLQRADLVVVSSDLLLQSKRRINPHTVLVRHGVDYSHYRKALDPATEVPESIAGLPRPVIGFFGLIADWIDVELLAAVARRFSQGSLVLLGKVTTDVARLKELPNVHLLGRQPYADLPAYCKGFDVALNPFRISELTLNANPLKVREYLAAGLPVVSTDLPEVAVIPECRIGKTTEAFIDQIEAALQQPGPRAERSLLMQDESWEAKLQAMEEHLAAAIERNAAHRARRDA